MKLLNKKSIGLDIADRTIEVIEVERSDNEFRALNFINANLPEGVVDNGRIKDVVKLTEVVKSIFSDSRPNPLSSRKVIFGLPEAQVFLHHFSLGPHEKKTRDALVLREITLSLPIKEDDLAYSYQIISDTPTETIILIAAASKEVTKEWLDFFKSIDIEVELFDIETLAVFRGLFKDTPQNPVCVLDIGSRTANICIFDRLGLRYSFSTFMAGDAFTEAITRTNGCDFATAEKIKIENGLSSTDDKLKTTLENELNGLINTVKETIEYYKNKTNGVINEIVLVGGSSQMKGLEEYIKKTLNYNVHLGSSRFHFDNAPLIYIEASGLAIRGLDNSWDEKDPTIPIKFKDGSVQSLPKTDEIQIGKINKQAVLLAGIVFVGLLLLAGAFWFSENQRKIRAYTVNTKINAENQSTTTQNSLMTTSSTPSTSTRSKDAEKLPLLKKKSL